MTRPFGASIADWLGKPSASGGLALGDGTVALVLTAAIVALTAYLARTRLDVQPAARGRPLAEIEESRDGR